MAKNMNLSIRYGSHLPVVIEAMDRTDGDVLELGAGVFSTPTMHWLCRRRGRQMMSVETDLGWLRWVRQHLKSPDKFHAFHWVEDWDKAWPLINKEWDVVLVDHSPSQRRVVEITKLANLAKYVIVHDANPWHDKLYHLSRIYPLFKWRYDFTEVEPHTVCLSNFIDLGNFHV